MIRIIVFCLIIGMLLNLLSGCASTPSTDRDQAAIEAGKAEILTELEQYYADLSARKWNAFASHFWPGATMTTVWQPPGEPSERVVTTTVPEFIAQAPQGPDSKAIFEEHMNSSDIRLQGSLAHVWAGYSARFGDPGNIAEWNGTDAFTLMKHGGRWKIVALAFASDV